VFHWNQLRHQMENVWLSVKIEKLQTVFFQQQQQQKVVFWVRYGNRLIAPI
jgi:hypothetical protein